MFEKIKEEIKRTEKQKSILSWEDRIKKINIKNKEEIINVHNEYSGNELGKKYDLSYSNAYDHYHKQDKKIDGIYELLKGWNNKRTLNKNDWPFFNKAFLKIEPFIKEFKDTNFETINFAEYKHQITKIFDILSLKEEKKDKKVNKCQWVAAAKIMHLAAPKVFVPWDNSIAWFFDIDIKRDESYIDFMTRTKQTYEKYKVLFNEATKHINANRETDTFEVTIPKLLDEYFFINITSRLNHLSNLNNLKVFIVDWEGCDNLR